MVDAKDLDSIPRSGRPPRAGNGHPLQYSCLENSMDRGVWRTTVHGVVKSWIRLNMRPFHCKPSSAVVWTVLAFIPDHNVAYMWSTEYLFYVLVSLHIPKFGSPSDILPLMFSKSWTISENPLNMNYLPVLLPVGNLHLYHHLHILFTHVGKFTLTQPLWMHSGTHPTLL